MTLNKIYCSASGVIIVFFYSRALVAALFHVQFFLIFLFCRPLNVVLRLTCAVPGYESFSVPCFIIVNSLRNIKIIESCDRSVTMDLIVKQMAQEMSLKIGRLTVSLSSASWTSFRMN